MSIKCVTYSEICGQPVEISGDLPNRRVTFKNQTTLTRAEALQALDIALGLNGLVVVAQNNSQGLKLVPLGATLPPRR
jgi:hypothetical protein